MEMLGSLGMSNVPDVERQEVYTTPTFNRTEFLCFTSDAPAKCLMKCQRGVIIISDHVASPVVTIAVRSTALFSPLNIEHNEDSEDVLPHISGDTTVVKKSLHQVSSRLHDNPSRSQHLLASSLTQTYPGSSHLVISSTAQVAGLTPVISASKGDVVGDWPSIYQLCRDENSVEEFYSCLLCAAANVGGVIGKGGGIIKQISQESRAFIKVDNSSSGLEDDSIITVSAKELFEDPVLSTIDVVFRLQLRCSKKYDVEKVDPSQEVSAVGNVNTDSGAKGGVDQQKYYPWREELECLVCDGLPMALRGELWQAFIVGITIIPMGVHMGQQFEEKTFLLGVGENVVSNTPVVAFLLDVVIIKNWCKKVVNAVKFGDHISLDDLVLLNRVISKRKQLWWLMNDEDQVEEQGQMEEFFECNSVDKY
jgi:hypothetical protein